MATATTTTTATTDANNQALNVVNVPGDYYVQGKLFSQMYINRILLSSSLPFQICQTGANLTITFPSFDQNHQLVDRPFDTDKATKVAAWATDFFGKYYEKLEKKRGEALSDSNTEKRAKHVYKTFKLFLQTDPEEESIQGWIDSISSTELDQCFIKDIALYFLNDNLFDQARLIVKKSDVYVLSSLVEACLKLSSCTENKRVEEAEKFANMIPIEEASFCLYLVAQRYISLGNIEAAKQIFDRMSDSRGYKDKLAEKLSDSQ